jgi:hypothetical protein
MTAIALKPDQKTERKSVEKREKVIDRHQVQSRSTRSRHVDGNGHD